MLRSTTLTVDWAVSSKKLSITHVIFGCYDVCACLLTVTPSSLAHLHVVGMLRFMSDINQPSLPTPFNSVLISVSVFMALSTVFHFQILPTTLRFLTRFFRSYLCLSTVYLFMKVSFSFDIIPSGLTKSRDSLLVRVPDS